MIQVWQNYIGTFSVESSGVYLCCISWYFVVKSVSKGQERAAEFFGEKFSN